MMNDERIVIGVDIGGTHITSARINLSDEKIIGGSKFTWPVNSNGNQNEILEAWIRGVKNAFEAGVKPIGIGVAIPGPFDYENGISRIKGVGKYESIYGANIKEVFSSAVGIKCDGIKFLNDASCFALGEYYAGAGKGCKQIAAITLGTGFGSTLISNGEIIANGVNVPEGGMFWSVPYKNGIADDYFATRWFVEEYFERTGVKISGVSELSAEYKTNRTASGLFNEFAQSLSLFLLPWLELFDAELLVIGGSISKAQDLFVPAMRKIFADHNSRIVIKISELGEDAALIGSANLFK